MQGLGLDAVISCQKPDKSIAHKVIAWCRGNAEEIVSSLQELEAMQEGTEELRKRVLKGDTVLRAAGTTFVDGLEQLQDLRRVESSVAASCRVGSACLTLLELLQYISSVW